MHIASHVCLHSNACMLEQTCNPQLLKFSQSTPGRSQKLADTCVRISCKKSHTNICKVERILTISELNSWMHVYTSVRKSTDCLWCGMIYEHTGIHSRLLINKINKWAISCSICHTGWWPPTTKQLEGQSSWCVDELIGASSEKMHTLFPWIPAAGVKVLCMASNPTTYMYLTTIVLVSHM